MATTKTTTTIVKKATSAKKSAPTKKVTAASKAAKPVATVTSINAAKSAKAAAPAKAANSTAKATQAASAAGTGNGKPDKTRVQAADLRAALLAGLSHTTEDAEDKQYAAVRLAITGQGLLRVNATDKVSAIRIVPAKAVTVAGKAFVAVIPASTIEDELAKPLRAQKDKRVDIWVGPKSSKPHLFVSMDNGKQLAVKLADWVYPDVDKLFDDVPSAGSLNAPIALDGARIALFADAVAEFVAEDAAVQAPIRMAFNGPTGTVRMEADLGDKVEIVGLLVPTKNKAVKATEATASAPKAAAGNGKAKEPSVGAEAAPSKS